MLISRHYGADGFRRRGAGTPARRRAGRRRRARPRHRGREATARLRPLTAGAANDARRGIWPDQGPAAARARGPRPSVTTAPASSIQKPGPGLASPISLPLVMPDEVTSGRSPIRTIASAIAPSAAHASAGSGCSAQRAHERRDRPRRCRSRASPTFPCGSPRRPGSGPRRGRRSARRPGTSTARAARRPASAATVTIVRACARNALQAARRPVSKPARIRSTTGLQTPVREARPAGFGCSMLC